MFNLKNNIITVLVCTDNITERFSYSRGASAYIRWNGYVSVNYTDTVVFEDPKSSEGKDINGKL